MGSIARLPRTFALSEKETVFGVTGHTGTTLGEQRYRSILGLTRCALVKAEAENNPASRHNQFRALLQFIASRRPAVKSAARDGDAEARSTYDALVVYEAHALVAIGRPDDALKYLDHLAIDADAAARSHAMAVRIDAHAQTGDHAAIAQELTRLLEAAGDDAGEILEAMLDRRRLDIERLETRGRDNESAVAARGTMHLVAEALDQWLDDQPTDTRPLRLVVAAADAFRSVGVCERARPLYDAALAEQPGHLTALVGRAECMFTAGADLEAAMAIYRRIGETLSERDGDTYWLAQLRMLQILDQTGRNTEGIAPHVRRLRAKDPELGGDRYRHEFDALERRNS